MAIDMRHTKLNAEEAALLSGELSKPSWQSRNEGIHERVSFEDTIWGFDLAGGSYYHTPLRVTAVKKNSRADKAGIRPGDRLKRINDIETSTLTIQEAHTIILESGVHLKIAVTAPEDEEDAYYCYEDPTLQDGYDSDEERRRQEEKNRKRQVHARVSHYWSLQWPWVSKRRIIYRESNCFMVPSKFEDKNRSKFPTQPLLKTTEDIVLDSVKSERELKDQKDANTLSMNGAPIMNGNNDTVNEIPTVKDTPNTIANTNINDNKVDNTQMLNGASKPVQKLNRLLSEVPETDEPSHDEISTQEDLTEDLSQIDEDMELKDHSQNEVSVDESNIQSENIEPNSEIADESQHDESMDTKDDDHVENSQSNDDDVINEVLEPNSEIADESQQDESMDTKDDDHVENSQSNDDDVINEVLEDESLAKGEEESIIESILSDGEEQMNHSDER